jgi:hypothetical protein
MFNSALHWRTPPIHNLSESATVPCEVPGIMECVMKITPEPAGRISFRVLISADSKRSGCCDRLELIVNPEHVRKALTRRQSAGQPMRNVAWTSARAVRLGPTGTHRADSDRRASSRSTRRASSWSREDRHLVPLEGLAPTLRAVS